MSESFTKVKGYLVDLGLEITQEDEAEHMVVVNNVDEGIVNLIVDCEEDVVIFEQHIFTLPAGDTGATARRLLEMNRHLVHGAFCVDGESRVLFRDTLRLDTLDFQELAGSIEALSLGMTEFGSELLAFSAEPVAA